MVKCVTTRLIQYDYGLPRPRTANCNKLTAIRILYNLDSWIGIRRLII